jgi:hypothetical protein
MAQEVFGARGADFLGAMGRLVVGRGERETRWRSKHMKSQGNFDNMARSGKTRWGLIPEFINHPDRARGIIWLHEHRSRCVPS